MDKFLKNIQLAGAVIIFFATIFAFGAEVKIMLVTRTVALADLLLLFIYLEVLGMVSSYWGSQRIQLTYPLFIAITAIARLIILQSKDLDAVILIYERMGTRRRRIDGRLSSRLSVDRAGKRGWHVGGHYGRHHVPVCARCVFPTPVGQRATRRAIHAFPGRRAGWGKRDLRSQCAGRQQLQALDQ